MNPLTLSFMNLMSSGSTHGWLTRVTLGSFLGCLLGAGTLAAEPDSTVCFEGRAVNGSQQPFPGVKVVLIGTPLSTMTDGTEAFTIAGDAGSLAKSLRSLALEFTAPGCEARTLVPAVTRQKDLAVVMHQAPTVGDPVTASRFVEDVPPGATPPPIDTKALGTWMAPQTVEIEWGVADGSQNVPLNGRVEGFRSALGKIEPLEQGNGMFSTARIMTELGVEGADKLMQEIGEYHQDIRAAAYEFFEHVNKMACDKTFEEAVFLQRVRNMLVMEIGDQLWLARATPRAWLQQGKKISVKNAPTYFGTLAYEILSDADHGKITATVEIPARKTAKDVILRLRHPKTAPIKSVTVNGKPWQDFDPKQEIITLKGLTGTVAVIATY